MISHRVMAVVDHLQYGVVGGVVQVQFLIGKSITSDCSSHGWPLIELRMGDTSSALSVTHSSVRINFEHHRTRNTTHYYSWSRWVLRFLVGVCSEFNSRSLLARKHIRIRTSTCYEHSMRQHYLCTEWTTDKNDRSYDCGVLSTVH